jgi:aspartate/methionine/tyrosine aminotransferase
MFDAAVPSLQAPSRNEMMSALPEYPFPRLAALLADVTPLANVAPSILTIGEPQNNPPPLLTDMLAASAPAAWAKYPPTAGTPEFRAAAAAWLSRRFNLPDGFVPADKAVLPVCGTREALYQLPQLVVPKTKAGGRPVVLIPNPFYAVYLGAALMAGAEPVMLDGTKETGFLPDLDSVSEEVWERTALFYLCSPANPQGAVASLDYLKRALTLARRHGFTLVMDECYGELWHNVPPAGGMDAARELGGDNPLSNLLCFHSLSKRSSAAGLRSGFMAGDPALIAGFTRLRAYSLAGMPLPVLAASAALWADDAHVALNRAYYRANVDAAEAILHGTLGYYRPDAGFFLWLDVTGVAANGEEATKRLWREGAIKVLPGAYLTQPHENGYNPGDRYIRVALVHDADNVARSMERLARILS